MSKRVRDPLPSASATDEEVADFWDTHSLADYLDEAEPVDSDLFSNAVIVRTGGPSACQRN